MLIYQWRIYFHIIVIETLWEVKSILALIQLHYSSTSSLEACPLSHELLKLSETNSNSPLKKKRLFSAECFSNFEM